jgi:hypothetical protein
MKIYNDEENHSGMKVIFTMVQMMVLLVVFTFVYYSYLAVGFAMREYGVSVLMYFPVLVALIVFPVLLYKYRQMFNTGKMMVAFTWTMGVASLTIVLLYVYIDQITG